MLHHPGDDRDTPTKRYFGSMRGASTIGEDYDQWAEQYDTNANRTRDLEAHALRTLLAHIPFARCLEIGCGTGKNTEWLVQKAEHITAVDLSTGMLGKAQEKIRSPHVRFVQADILSQWDFADGMYELVTFSLVLEHIEDLKSIFEKASRALSLGGHLYLGELHPFKQYAGTKARFGTNEGIRTVTCYDHHVSDFVHAAATSGLTLVHLGEHFDNDDRGTLPRILSLLLRKND